MTQFALTGHVGPGKSSRIIAPHTSNSGFTPMTPGTRKSVDPFSGRGQSGQRRGQISVLEVPSTSPTSPSDESVIFWLGESFTIIPCLAKYWAANHAKVARGSGTLFGGSSGDRPHKN